MSNAAILCTLFAHLNNIIKYLTEEDRMETKLYNIYQLHVNNIFKRYNKLSGISVGESDVLVSLLHIFSKMFL